MESTKNKKQKELSKKLFSVILFRKLSESFQEL